MQIATTRQSTETTEIMSAEIMSANEKRLLRTFINESEPLPYKIKAMKVAVGPDAQEYIIPEEDKAKVLRDLYPFDNPPSVEDRLFCLHEEKYFRVGDFKVIREDGRNYLVSPFYDKSGGMVIDWMPEGDEKRDKVFTEIKQVLKK
jgi:hypothetical protein